MCVCNDKYRNLFDNIKTRVGNQRLGDADAFGGHVRFRVHGGRGGESVRVIPHQRADADAALSPESHHLVALLEYLAALEGEHECTFAGLDILWVIDLPDARVGEVADSGVFGVGDGFIVTVRTFRTAPQGEGLEADAALSQAVGGNIGLGEGAFANAKAEEGIGVSIGKKHRQIPRFMRKLAECWEIAFCRKKLLKVSV